MTERSEPPMGAASSPETKLPEMSPGPETRPETCPAGPPELRPEPAARSAPAASPRIVSAWNIANALTVVRLAMVPIFTAFLFLEGATWRSAALGVFLFASFTDQLDGWLARRYALITDFGKIADPIADKALIGAALVSLSILGEIPWWVTVVIIVRESGVTLLRFAVIRHGVIPASYGGKVKTVLQIAAIALYILPIGPDLLRWGVMGLALIVTVGTGIDYVVRAMRLRQVARRARAE
jgi:CDP-diacylglycerol--glycerol-3-phosphate 3-phosphatidyltransferase